MQESAGGQTVKRGQDFKRMRATGRFREEECHGLTSISKARSGCCTKVRL